MSSIVSWFVYKNSARESNWRTGGRAFVRIVAFVATVIGFVGILLYSCNWNGWKDSTQWIRETSKIGGVNVPLRLIGDIGMLFASFAILWTTRPRAVFVAGSYSPPRRSALSGSDACAQFRGIY